MLLGIHTVKSDSDRLELAQNIYLARVQSSTSTQALPPSPISPLCRDIFTLSLVCEYRSAIISLGLATLKKLLSGCHGTDSPHDNKELTTFLSEGVKAEGSAQKRGEGVSTRQDGRGKIPETEKLALY